MLKKFMLSIGASVVVLLLLLGQVSYAAGIVVGTTSGGLAMEVEDIRYAINYDVFEMQSGYLELMGANLKGVTVLFEKAGIGFEEMGNRVTDTDGFIKITLTPEEAGKVTGRLRIGNKTFNLDTATFPNIQNSNRQTIIKGQNQSIIFTGNNLNLLNTPSNPTGTYGSGLSFASLGTGSTSSVLTLVNPNNPGSLGYQNIYIKSAKPATVTTPHIAVEYTYSKAFRIIEELGVTDVVMFPNTGAKGDEVYFRSDYFSDTRNYVVYFLKALDGSDQPSSVNRATFVSLGLNVDGDVDVLTVKVPEDPAFEKRNYYVLIADEQNGQIVAEHYVKKLNGLEDQYTVIEANYKPSIVSVYPAKGPDTGSNVEIKANYVLTLNIPDLVTTGNIVGQPTGTAADTALNLNYDNGVYKGENVSIKRTVTTQIGKKATFVKNAAGEFQLEKALPDKMIVRTEPVNDAETDPKKDVVIQIKTTLTVMSGANAGSEYVFNQIVNLADGYEFEPSTYTPIIDSVLPPVIQIEPTSGGFTKMKEEVLISIKGEKFLVDRVVKSDGSVITRKPTVLIKKDDSNTFENRFQLGFFPNEEYIHNGVKYIGVIRYKNLENDSTSEVLMETLTNGTTRPITPDITVLTKKGVEVDGLNANSLGENIVIRIPAIAKIKDAGVKHIQVTNPIKKSPAFGNSAIKSDIIEFVNTSDVPVIEKVKPAIITVDGGEEIVIYGANIAAAVRLYLDGNEITNFTRELDPSGNRILIRFIAPKGREGTTQILLQNPSGGHATADFTYVQSFNKNPIFDRFSPPAGTADTLVLIDGDNFLKPDPTAVTERGVDAYRLIGTRVVIDGVEVNQYKKDTTGKIIFDPYTVPSAQPAIIEVAGKATFSPLYENTTATDAAGKVASLGPNEKGYPTIKMPDREFAIRKAAGGGYEAFDMDGNPVGVATIATSGNVTTVSIPSAGETFTITMNNQLIRKGLDEEGQDKVFLSNYAESITMKTATDERFVLYYNFAGNTVLTNGKNKNYTVVVDGAGFAVEDSLGNQMPVTPNSDGLNLDGQQLYMINPYLVNSVTGVIEGNRTKVLSKTQILFSVPSLATGKGHKDVVVINPDTKSASKTGNSGFYYIPQATSNPIISSIKPNKGSVDGGYYVTIRGSDFEDDVRVYIDAQEISVNDQYVALDGKSITIKMIASNKNLTDDYGVDKMAVPVVVLNPDGGTAGVKDGFTYIIPKSAPVINKIVPADGTSNGGQIVELTGYEFRFYEPYENVVGTANYEIGDKYIDIYPNGVWDDLLGVHDAGAIAQEDELTNPYYEKYYVSPLLPKVYFGEHEANIVEFSRGYIKVITPPHKSGKVDVYVINNDSGVSNKMAYQYQSTDPIINELIPDIGSRGGQEPKEIFGSKMYKSILKGYLNDDPSSIHILPDVQAVVRFGDIDNTDLDRIDPNSGLINNRRTTVNLDGGLRMEYVMDVNGDATVKLMITENNKIYTRTFDYDHSVVYVPVGMLVASDGNYYKPSGIDEEFSSTYVEPYEYIRLSVEDRRVYVERGFAPKAIYDSASHVIVYTPSYYTIGRVPMTYTNPDGGTATREFIYTNPASKPKIYRIEPQTLSFNKDAWLVESSVDGGIDIEIIGEDLREGLTVKIGNKLAKIKELTKKTINGVEYDLVIVTVPKASVNDIDVRYPVLLQNEDKGIAMSNNIKDLIGPNYGTETIPYYFVYKKPLSFPRIDTVEPSKTSVHGGNTVVITGSDFRQGAYVIIGTRAGIPIYNGVISERGTKYTFTTPDNMTLGLKDVQVLNNDYGLGIMKDAITVVSAPTVDPVVTNVDGSVINRIHVTGGQKIKITGTGFQEGLKVYFGGDWKLAGANTPEPEQGIYINDKIYTVENGAVSTEVEWVDEKTIIVTTPAVTKEGKVTLVVLNPDSGISDNSAELEYKVPVPTDPMGLKVTIVDNRYIKIYDYVATNAKYFEIYAYIGSKTDQQLKTIGYRDFKYLGVTEVEPYKIIELPGYDRMNPNERIVFVVKAVNKFGQSGWSNLAHLTYYQVQKIEELGPEDLDGDVGVAPGQDYDHHIHNDTVEVTLADKLSSPSINIDLRPYLQKGVNKKRLLIPDRLVKSSQTSVSVSFGDSMFRITPVVLNTYEFQRVAQYEKAYAVIQEEPASAGYLTPRIRGKKQASAIHRFGFSASANSGDTSFTNLEGSMDITLYYQTLGLSNVQQSQIQLYYYDSSRATYVLVPATLDMKNRRVIARIQKAGHYVLLTNQF